MSNPNGPSSSQTTNTPLRFKRQELPGLYRSASSASKQGRSIYFLGLKLYLILLVFAAFISYAIPEGRVGAALSAVLFIASLLVLVYLKFARPDDIWYNGRAVAESVKTIAWRWMMRAEPYKTGSINEVKTRCIDDLLEILKENEKLSEYLSATEGIQDPISDKMEAIRELNVEKRLQVYTKDRVAEQKNWYSKKSNDYKRNADICFWVSVMLHIAAVVLSLFRIQDPPPKLPVEVVATIAGAVLTWLEANKYRELTSSYKLAAHEVSLILGKASSVDTEEKLATFVQDSESAFSRENTQWVSKRVS